MAPHTLRWGIISTGGISTAFSKDLLVDPSTRDASDVLHKITAVGSRAKDTAQKFVDGLNSLDKSAPGRWGVEQGNLKDCKAYGSYAEVFADPNVDIVYIGTPHTFHHENSKDALLGGKHVICEKPFTFDIEELDELIKIATEKKLFLMEAVWTRFQPIAYAVQDVIHSGKIGKVNRMTADLSVNNHPDTLPLTSRMIDPAQGGGGILDLGPYPSVWTMLVLYHHPDNKKAAPKLVSSRQTIYPRTRVDETSMWTLKWDNLKMESDLRTSLVCSTLANNTVTVYGEEGDLVIEFPPYKPNTYHIYPHKNPGAIKEASKHVIPAHPGGAMHYEADECARCIRDGKLESERMPHEESRIVQLWFDDVRKAGDSILKNHKGTAGK